MLWYWGLGRSALVVKWRLVVGSIPFSVLPILGEHDFSEELLQNTRF
jgi:hypothetical protein